MNSDESRAGCPPYRGFVPVVIETWYWLRLFSNGGFDCLTENKKGVRTGRPSPKHSLQGAPLLAWKLQTIRPCRHLTDSSSVGGGGISRVRQSSPQSRRGKSRHTAVRHGNITHRSMPEISSPTYQVSSPKCLAIATTRSIIKDIRCQIGRASCRERV